MSCIGDKVAGYDSSQKCYQLDGCLGCDKCTIECDPPCENCPGEVKLRAPEVGDYITVQRPILASDYKGPKWNPAQDNAIGRTAWVAKGDPSNGYYLKFNTTKKEILDSFVYPLEALRLAMPEDNTVDKLIRTTKAGDPNFDM